jgi:hypothetical protein
MDENTFSGYTGFPDICAGESPAHFVTAYPQGLFPSKK